MAGDWGTVFMRFGPGCNCCDACVACDLGLSTDGSGDDGKVLICHSYNWPFVTPSVLVTALVATHEAQMTELGKSSYVDVFATTLPSAWSPSSLDDYSLIYMLFGPDFYGTYGTPPFQGDLATWMGAGGKRLVVSADFTDATQATLANDALTAAGASSVVVGTNADSTTSAIINAANVNDSHPLSKCLRCVYYSATFDVTGGDWMFKSNASPNRVMCASEDVGDSQVIASGDCNLWLFPYNAAQPPRQQQALLRKMYPYNGAGGAAV